MLALKRKGQQHVLVFPKHAHKDALVPHCVRQFDSINHSLPNSFSVHQVKSLCHSTQ